MKVISITEDSVGKAWATAVLEVFFFGEKIKTEYDGPTDFPSRDVTGLIHVKRPYSKPLRGYEVPIYAHMGDLYATESIKSKYLEEIVDGIHDHEIGEGPSFPYTYHDRITNYRWKSTEDGLSPNLLEEPVDQIKYMINKLKSNGYSRRAQAVTWRAHTDPGSVDPPCLQRLWARIVNGKLVFETTWRSRDLFKAWGANVNGMLAWAKKITDQLDVDLDCYVDFSNSLHIYGKKKVVIEVTDFIERLMKRHSKKYDSKYLDAFEEFQTTKFYQLYSKKSDLQRLLSRLGEHEKEDQNQLTTEIQDILDEIGELSSYNG